MDGFQKVSDIATNSMDISQLHQFISSKLGEILASNHASRVAGDVISAITDSLGSKSLDGHFAVERAGRALNPASSNKIIIHQEACESKCWVDGSLALRHHEAQSIAMHGSPPGTRGQNIILSIPMHSVELDRNKARLLAERLMAFAASGELSVP